MAVSYTHLDVYKRQVKFIDYFCIIQIGHSYHFIHKAIFREANQNLIIRLYRIGQISGTPVSYTHLDVYKRQEYPGLILSSFPVNVVCKNL